MVYELDEDTALSNASAGLWVGVLTDRWMIGGGPNGGYIATFLIRAMREESVQPDPLTMTTHFLTRPEPGRIDVEVTVLHEAGAHAFLQANLSQMGQIRAISLATFGRLRPDEIRSTQATMPEAADPDTAATRPLPPGLTAGPAASFLDRFDHREASGELSSLWHGVPGRAEVGGWTRLSDGRPMDALAVPLLMDAYPPAMFATFQGGMAPTVELTVHWRDRPGPEWQLLRFSSRFLQSGYTEEDGEMWSTDGRLVAQSRQLARFRTPPT